MSIKSYKEKEIRNAIIRKVKPRINHGRHGKGYICIDEKVVAKVKIPNNHKKIMHKSKSKFIARDLKLDDEDFNKLIDCPLKGTEYYAILTQAVS